MPDAHVAPQTSRNPGIQVAPLNTRELRTSGVKSSAHLSGVGKTGISSVNPLTEDLPTPSTLLEARGG